MRIFIFSDICIGVHQPNCVTSTQPQHTHRLQTSIAELVKALSRCTPHYVRCIKPNNNKAADQFDYPLVEHQARYLALLENVRVRRAGYAYRHPYEKFYFRYRVCSKKTWPKWYVLWAALLPQFDCFPFCSPVGNSLLVRIVGPVSSRALVWSVIFLAQARRPEGCYETHSGGFHGGFVVVSVRNIKDLYSPARDCTKQ